jgi:hypothetical protein
MRFPGTGDGVARLVLVAIVTFDIGAPSRVGRDDSQARALNG